MSIEALKEILSQSDASVNRTTVLRPLQVIIIILVILLSTNSIFGKYEYITVGIGIFLAVIIGFYLLVYWTCLKNCPDNLRTESYVIKKMTLEKITLGDNTNGIQEIEISTGKIISQKIEG